MAGSVERKKEHSHESRIAAEALSAAGSELDFIGARGDHLHTHRVVVAGTGFIGNCP